MAQLTLTQRATMANDGYFQLRMVAALKKTANYWKNTIINLNNTAVYKRRLFAKQIQDGQLPQMKAYCEFYLSNYNEDVATNRPDGNPRLDENSQLSDLELTDGGVTPVVYDYFAGVQSQDV